MHFAKLVAGFSAVCTPHTYIIIIYTTTIYYFVYPYIIIIIICALVFLFLFSVSRRIIFFLKFVHVAREGINQGEN